MKLPAIHLYPGDWLRDTVAGCSLAAQGLWLRMMFLMHDSERYGYLIVNGSPMTPESIARRCGCTPGEYETLFGELDAAGIPGRTKGNLIFSRRMVRDADERQKNSERQKQFRSNRLSNAESNGSVTGVSHESNAPSSVSSSEALPNGKDARPSVWDLGEELLTRSGWTKKNSRAFIGRQIKDFDEEAVAEVLGKTALKAPADPGAYIVQTLKQVWIKSGKSPPLGDVIYCPDCNTNGMHEMERDGQRGYVPCPNKNGKHA